MKCAQAGTAPQRHSSPAGDRNLPGPMRGHTIPPWHSRRFQSPAVIPDIFNRESTSFPRRATLMKPPDRQGSDIGLACLRLRAGTWGNVRRRRPMARSTPPFCRGACGSQKNVPAFLTPRKPGLGLRHGSSWAFPDSRSPITHARLQGHRQVGDGFRGNDGSDRRASDRGHLICDGLAEGEVGDRSHDQWQRPAAFVAGAGRL